MNVCETSWPTLLQLCLLLCAPGVASQQFSLQPLNATVLQGTNTQFRATVEGDWPFMTWEVGELLALTVPVGDNATSESKQFSAQLCTPGDISCVDFTIHNVNREMSGPIVCSVQGDYGSKTAQLFVQESGTVNIVEENVTVNEDQQVELHCVTTAWFPAPTITWAQNGHPVDSSLYNTTSDVMGDYFNSTSLLTFQAVRNTTVECLASVPTLPNPLSTSVFLTVVPKPTDWTVLIAIVLSFGCAALLVLLIIGIIFCYKRRKEKQSNYQDEMTRRVRTQSQISTVSGVTKRRGQVNTGFEPDGQTSVTPSDLTDSGFYQTNRPGFYAMPDIVTTTRVENSVSITVDVSGVRKHRHATVV